MRRVWHNEDNAHFYDQHPPEDMTEVGVRRLVDTWAKESKVKAMLLNVNVQRALFDSRVWTPLDAGYDPDGPDDQPLLASLEAGPASLTPDGRGRYWVHNIHLLRTRGVDHPRIWIEQSRACGAEGWLTVRMNDCHHNDDEDSFWHSELWKERKELRRFAQARDGDWFETAFDYAHDEVVEHHWKLIEEVVTRYKPDGVELDFVRWIRHFRPGHETLQAAKITELVRRVRGLCRSDGRNVRLGVRLPPDPDACLGLGYEIDVWGREKLMDAVALSPFLEQARYDWPVRLWRAVVGDDVEIVCQPESVTRPFPASAQKINDYRQHAGQASAAYAAGADGIYLFNDCYRETPGDKQAVKYPGLVRRLADDYGDPAALAKLPRRFVVSYPQIVAPGRGTASPLPVHLKKPRGHWSFGRHGGVISFCLSLGDGPFEEPKLQLVLDGPPASRDGWQVWINAELLADAPREDNIVQPVPPGQALAWDVPAAMLHAGDNVVDFLPPDGVGDDAKIVWAEIATGSA
jgi:hypothetical protein